MRKKILNDLNLEKNLCFNQVKETKDAIYITKSKTQISSVVEIKEICDIEQRLSKYKKESKVIVSWDKIIIKLK